MFQIHSGTINYSKPFIAEVANAKLIGSDAVGFDEDRNLLSETIPTSGNLEDCLPTQTLFLSKLPDFGVPQLDTACSLLNFRSTNYYHWMTDSLLRLEGLEYYQRQTGRKPTLIIDSNPPSWQTESLRLLGYEPDDYIPWNGSRLKVERLVIPSLRLKQRSPSPSACRWLCQTMLNNLPNVASENLSFSSRIYISRPKKVGRNVINEDEVMEALTPFGFVAYTLESMSFADKVRLFSKAEIVVAPHGAGLVHTIFAPQNLVLIEIFGYFIAAEYFLIAKTMGFHYRHLWCNPEQKTQYVARFKGIIVDIPKLKELVAEMLDIHSDRKLVDTVY